MRRPWPTSWATTGRTPTSGTTTAPSATGEAPYILRAFALSRCRVLFRSAQPVAGSPGASLDDGRLGRHRHRMEQSGDVVPQRLRHRRGHVGGDLLPPGAA